MGALRYDYFSNQSLSHLTPKLSVRYRPVRRLTFRFGYGMGFRAPTLKEKYYNFDMAGIWTVDGNPNLKAEVSHNFNLSAEYFRGRYCFTMSGYYNNINDKIATGAPYYKNLSDVIPHLPYLNLADYSVVGGEFTALARWSNGLSARFSYALTDEHLPRNKNNDRVNNQYIPARKHSLSAQANWDHQFGTKGINTIHYPAYSIWKLSTVHRLGKAVKLTVTLDNLLNYKPKYYYLNAPLTDGLNLQVGASVDLDNLF